MTGFLAVSLVALLVLNLYPAAEGQLEAVARFNSRGISGYIRFTELESGDIRIQANLRGLRGAHTWHVHNLPVDQTANPSIQCLNDMVGPHYDPFNRNNGDDYRQQCEMNSTLCEAGDLAGKFGPLMPNTAFDMVDNSSTLFLNNRYSIVGRSIVIHQHLDSTNFECATIRSVREMGGTPVVLLQASFIKPIAGTIYFRQVQGENAVMWGKFYWTNDSPTTTGHPWHIHSIAPGEEYRTGNCSNIEGHFRPFLNGPPGIDNYTDVCNPDLTGGCEVGDLTGKHAAINVQALPQPYSTGAFFFTDNFLNLTGENSVLNLSVAIHQDGPVVACAPLVMSENIVLYQYGSRDISVSQGSPFEDTVITSSGSRARTDLQKFAFNQLVVNCLEPTETLFSPYAIVDISGGVYTPDKYALGALQDRYSNITGAGTWRVFDVPVYGANVSISSLTLRTESDGETCCSALTPMLRGDKIIVAKASFSRVLRGAIYFVQKDNGFGQLGNTHIIVDIYYADSTWPETSGHNWHVHQIASPSADAECSPAIAGHYNPFHVSLANTDDDNNPSSNSNYRSDCSPSSQLRCESGDLGGKHGRLRIEPEGQNRPTYTYVDSNVHLSGSFKIVNRSIGIHNIDREATIFDCGTVNRVYVSAIEVEIQTNPSTMLRTTVVQTLADKIDGVDPTDILILNQKVSPLGFGFDCVTVSIRVLGTSQMEADSYATRLNATVGDLFACSGSAILLASSALSQAIILILPLLALLYTLILGCY